MKIEINKCQRDFFLHGEKLTTKNGEKWYYFPFWLKETSEIDTYEMVSFKELPEGIKKFIENKREK